MLVALAADPARRSTSSAAGKLIQPTNMITMAVQAAGIAIIATGMVLVIVSRNIDLSVGSLVGLIAMSYALLMTDWFPHILGHRRGLPVPVGPRPRPRDRRSARASARVQGFIIAYIGVPSFIVTLGGLLSIRGLVWYQSQGAAVVGPRPDLPAHRRRRARARSARLITWVVGVVGCVGDRRLAATTAGAAAALRLPAPADVGRGAPRRSSAAPPSSASPAFANANFWPHGPRRPVRHGARHHAAAGRPADPDRVPVSRSSSLIGVTLVMTFIATRRRFGRYVYAYGGNPDAAELAGINTRWTILKTYVLMGVLCALAAAIAAARLNGATLDIGAELRAVRHRRRGRRRDVVRGRHRDDPGRRPGRVRDAVAGVRLELHRRELARPERRRRRRPDPRRRPRHLEPPARRHERQGGHGR